MRCPVNCTSMVDTNDQISHCPWAACGNRPRFHLKERNSFYILKTIENATGASVAFLINISVIQFSIYL